MLTSAEILEEYTKCLLDPKYPIQTFFKTFDKTQEGFVPFKLFPKQRDIIDDFRNHRFNLVTKPRQAGISTVTQAYAAVLIGFADPKNPETILVVANKLKLAKKFTKGIKDFVNQLPRWVWGSEYYGTPEKERKAIFIKESQDEIELVNGCKIVAVATSEDALRGYTPTLLIMDEAAFIDRGDELFAAALTSLGTGGKATLISTPNGHDSLYYKTYEQSKEGLNDFNIIEMRWYQDLRYNKDLRWYKWLDKEETKREYIEEYEFTFESYEKKRKAGYQPTSSWYEEMCRSMNNDKRKIAQELDVSFLGSGGNVIEDKYIQHHESYNVCEPKWKAGKNNNIWIWEQPIPDHEYLLASDVSRGDGEDSSTFTIIDVTTMEQVVEMVDKVPPDKLAEILYEYGILYNALIVVDITGGMGVTTTLKLKDMKYPNLYYEERGGKLLKKRKDESKYDRNLETPGFQVGSDRVALVSNLEKMIRINCDEGINHGIKIRSIRLINEFHTFIYRNGRADHQDGKHDDLIMALGIGLYILEFSFRKLKTLKSKTKTMLKSWVVNVDGSQNTHLEQGSGFVPKVNKGVKALPKPNFDAFTSRNMQDPSGRYLWLLSGSK
jgi:hypothetical protein